MPLSRAACLRVLCSFKNAVLRWLAFTWVEGAKAGAGGIHGDLIVRILDILLRVKHDRGGEHHQNREAKCDLCAPTCCHALRSGNGMAKKSDNLAQFVSSSYACLEEDLHTRRISHVRTCPTDESVSPWHWPDVPAGPCTVGLF